MNLLCSKLFLLCPYSFTSLSGSGAIFSVLLVFIIAFLFFAIYTKNKPSFINDRIKTPALKGFFGTVSSIFLLLSGTVTLSLVIYFTKMTSLSSSPLSFITVPFAVCMLCAAYPGLKCLGKLHGFFCPMLYILLAVLVLFCIPEFDFTNLTPIFGKGFINVFLKGFFMLSNLFEILIFLYLPPYVKGSYKKTVFSSLGISLVLYLLAVSAFLLIGGKTPDLPMFSVIRSGLLKSLDSVFLILYTISSMLYLSAVLFFSTKIFADSFEIKQAKNLIIPFGLILISFSSISFFSSYGQKFLSALSRFLWAIPFLLPFLFKEKRS